MTCFIPKTDSIFDEYELYKLGWPLQFTSKHGSPNFYQVHLTPGFELYNHNYSALPFHVLTCASMISVASCKDVFCTTIKLGSLLINPGLLEHVLVEMLLDFVVWETGSADCFHIFSHFHRLLGFRLKS